MNAPPEYTTRANIMARIAQAMATPVAQLAADAPHWLGTCESAELSANSLVHRTFLGRGYTADQILQDPGYLDLATRVGVCHAFRQAALANTVNLEAVKMACDCEQELKEIPLAGASQVQTASGGIGYGRMLIADEIDKCRW